MSAKIILKLLALAAFASDATVSLNADPAPLGLPRLIKSRKPGEPAPLDGGKHTVVDLSPRSAPGVKTQKQDQKDILAIDPSHEWSTPLRGSGRDVTFVSFELYPSHSTVVEIGGARIGVTTSPIAGSFQLAYYDATAGPPKWRALNAHYGAEQYGGRLLAMLPLLTVRIDPEAGLWDIFSDSRLLADNLPLSPTTMGQRDFVIRAGADGAWLTGLVMSDENPLYEDANANSIDDRFERQTRGGLLPSSADPLVRGQLAAQWKEQQRVKRPPSLHVKRPLPDGTVSPHQPTGR